MWPLCLFIHDVYSFFVVCPAEQSHFQMPKCASFSLPCIHSVWLVVLSHGRWSNNITFYGFCEWRGLPFQSHCRHIPREPDIFKQHKPNQQMWCSVGSACTAPDRNICHLCFPVNETIMLPHQTALTLQLCHTDVNVRAHVSAAVWYHIKEILFFKDACMDFFCSWNQSWQPFSSRLITGPLQRSDSTLVLMLWMRKC